VRCREDRDEEVPMTGYPPQFDEFYVVSDIHMERDSRALPTLRER
jgi:hypothetical protein